MLPLKSFIEQAAKYCGYIAFVQCIHESITVVHHLLFDIDTVCPFMNRMMFLDVIADGLGALNTQCILIQTESFKMAKQDNKHYVELLHDHMHYLKNVDFTVIQSLVKLTPCTVFTFCYLKMLSPPHMSSYPRVNTWWKHLWQSLQL